MPATRAVDAAAIRGYDPADGDRRRPHRGRRRAASRAPADAGPRRSGPKAATKASAGPPAKPRRRRTAGAGSPAPRDASRAAPRSHPTAILHRAVDEAARLLGPTARWPTCSTRRRASSGSPPTPGSPTTAAGRGSARSGSTSASACSARPSPRARSSVTGDYPADPSFVHFPDADRLVRDLAIHSFARRAAGQRRPHVRGHGHVLEPARTPSTTRRSPSSGRSPTTPPRRCPTPTSSSSSAGRERTSSAAPRRSSALREIGGQIIGLRHPEEVLQRSVDEAARLLGADGARIDILDEASGGLYWAYDATTGRRPGLGPIAGSGEAQGGGGDLRQGRPRDAADLHRRLPQRRPLRARPAPDAHVRRYQIRSVVAVPLIGDRGPLGTLTVYTGERDAFGEDDARIIEALAGQAAIAMTNARLIEELDRSREQFSRQADAERALREIAARITAIRDPSDLLQHVVDEAARLLGAERVRIDLIMPAAGRVGFTHVPGAGDIIGGAAVDEEGQPFRTAPPARRSRRARPSSAPTTSTTTGSSTTRDLDEAVRRDGIRSLIVTPLTGEEGMLGVLQVGLAGSRARSSRRRSGSPRRWPTRPRSRSRTPA